jgi:hypothetical protein
LKDTTLLMQGADANLLASMTYHDARYPSQFEIIFAKRTGAQLFPA